MITAIAVDDEPIALEILKLHAAKIPFLDLQAVFVNTTKALGFIRNCKIDLVFLDIRMPDLSGFEFASAIPENIHIVFTTAHPEHAVEGFNIAATDFLLKPISLARLLQACDLVSRRISLERDKFNKQSFFVKDGYKLVKIDMDKITYIEADDNYLSIYEGEKRTLTRMTLTEILNKLPAYNFQRVHKSFVISLAKVDRIEGNHLLINNKKVPVSVNYKDQLMLSIGQSF